MDTSGSMAAMAYDSHRARRVGPHSGEPSSSRGPSARAICGLTSRRMALAAVGAGAGAEALLACWSIASWSSSMREMVVHTAEVTSSGTPCPREAIASERCAGVETIAAVSSASAAVAAASPPAGASSWNLLATSTRCWLMGLRPSNSSGLSLDSKLQAHISPEQAAGASPPPSSISSASGRHSTTALRLGFVCTIRWRVTGPSARTARYSRPSSARSASTTSIMVPTAGREGSDFGRIAESPSFRVL
mmetsp:Transcript_21994/g.61040  ORF Transcript_21994/g.61040 Transcript_21994/m.61040 type:complete len:248 (-) Transcript_21994:800-1543(-)